MKLERSLNQFINKKLIFNLILFFCIFYPLTIKAQILITEVMYNPEGNDDDREWIEAINLGENINVKTGKNGWRIFDGKNRILKGENFTWGKNEIIIFVQDINKFLNEYPQVRNKLVEVSFYLKNKEGEIKIIDENKNVLAEFKYNSNIGGNNNGYSLIYENGQIIEGRTYKGSPGIYPEPSQKTEKPKEETIQNIKATTSLATKTQENTNQINTSSKEEKANQISQTNIISTSTLEEKEEKEEKYTLLITEFLPNLKGKDEGEFVEIYNYGDEKIDLSNVYLVVGNKKIKLYGEIEPEEYKVFYNTELGFNIKNSGDTIKLIDKKNNVIFSISYKGKSKEGKSFARDENGNWRWSNPTPQKENVFIEEAVSKENNENPETNYINYEDKENLNAQNLADINKNLSKTNNLQVLLIGLVLAIIFSIIFILFFK